MGLYLELYLMRFTGMDVNIIPSDLTLPKEVECRTRFTLMQKCFMITDLDQSHFGRDHI
jgi:hypothetical protein